MVIQEEIKGLQCFRHMEVVQVKGRAVILCQRVCREQGGGRSGIGIIYTLLVQTGLYGQIYFMLLTFSPDVENMNDASDFVCNLISLRVS